MLERLLKNWKTSAAAVVALAVAAGAWLGFDVDPEPIKTLLIAVESILLMFVARD